MSAFAVSLLLGITIVAAYKILTSRSGGWSFGGMSVRWGR